MKKGFHSSALLLLFLFLLFSSSSTRSTARNLAAKKELKEPSTGDSVTAKELEDTFELATLMGAEELICRGEDGGEEEEECLRRRMISEAHLDYIYTQRHKP